MSAVPCTCVEKYTVLFVFILLCETPGVSPSSPALLFFICIVFIFIFKLYKQFDITKKPKQLGG